ncbi:MAG: glycosyltransferase family 4 protein [Vicinamibacterales bacterium]
MRVAIDARELAGHPTGVGRYLRELLREWRNGPATAHDIVLYSHRPPPEPPDDWPLRIVPGSGGTRWEQWEFARALGSDRPDVLFAPGYTAPLACPAPVALAVHDVSYFAHPEWFRAREGLRRRQITAWAARRAHVVLAPSAFSASEIVRFTGVPASRVRVVYLGVRAPATPPARERRPLVLFVGSLFQRRRIDVLIDAFARVVADHPAAHLDIVGDNRTMPRLDFTAQVAALGLGARVGLRHWVDDETLTTLYSDAAVFAFLSEYEGFGFTPLEALAHGAVPVVLDTPVAREIYGEAAVQLADGPHLVESLAATLRHLLADPAARAPHLAAALPVLARYHWRDTAAHTWRAIEEAAGA